MSVRNSRSKYLGEESFLPKRTTKKLKPLTKGKYAIYNNRVSYRREGGRLKVIGGE